MIIQTFLNCTLLFIIFCCFIVLPKLVRLALAYKYRWGKIQKIPSPLIPLQWRGKFYVIARNRYFGGFVAIQNIKNGGQVCPPYILRKGCVYFNLRTHRLPDNLLLLLHHLFHRQYYNMYHLHFSSVYMKIFRFYKKQ